MGRVYQKRVVASIYSIHLVIFAVISFPHIIRATQIEFLPLRINTLSLPIVRIIDVLEY